MSATFNWAYKPGVTNKYNITISASADNVQPSNACYVALFGNDVTGNGSRQYPYRTLGKALSSYTTYYIVGGGVYREGGINPANQSGIIIGDGDVVVDLTLFTSFFQNGINSANGFYNLTFRATGSPYISSDMNNASFFDCIINGVTLEINNQNLIYDNGNINKIQNCIFINSVFIINSTAAIAGAISNNTFYNTSIHIRYSVNHVYGYILNNIFHSCNIEVDGPVQLDFCLFYQCNFRFNASFLAPAVLLFYPGVPTGYNYINTLAGIQGAFNTAFSTSNTLLKCLVADPLFNNLSINNFTLQFASPAKNLSYLGTYVGARSVAQNINARATEANGDFDFSSNSNLSVADDSITLTSQTTDAQIDSKVLVNSIQRAIRNIHIYGFAADRNGQYVDSIPDLDTFTRSPTDVLNVPAPYLVSVASVTYNGTIYQPGDRFTTVTGVTSFTTAAGGLLTEILEAPERHTVMMRFGNGGANVNAGDALVVGYWYYVITSSVTYDGVVYNAGQVFKAIDTNAFSGAGTVMIALSTETFNHFDPGIQPTTNNVGDSSVGAPLRGNGDPAYVRGGLGVKEFTINAKFIQLRFYVRVSNLRP